MVVCKPILVISLKPKLRLIKIIAVAVAILVIFVGVTNSSFDAFRGYNLVCVCRWAMWLVYISLFVNQN